MRILITAAIAAAGLAMAASSAYADGTTDFWSMQKGYGYDAAPAPAAPAGWPFYEKWLGQPAAVQPAAERRDVHHRQGRVIEPSHE